MRMALLCDHACYKTAHRLPFNQSPARIADRLHAGFKAIRVSAGNTWSKWTMKDLQPVFVALRSVMALYASNLDCKEDSDSQLYVDTHHIQSNKKPLFFGAVHVKKSYVSYHLMPIYLTPELLVGVSESLRSRMQGKSCFNFSQVDEPLFAELGLLTEASYASYAQQGFV